MTRSLLMRISSLFILSIAFLLHSSLTVRVADPVRVLVFSKTKGWKHTSIPFGIAAIQKLGRENNFLVDTTKNAAVFTDENLKKYATVIFNNTTGNIAKLPIKV